MNRSPHTVDRWSAEVLAAAPELVAHGLDRHRRSGRTVTEGSVLTHRGWTRLGTIAGSSPALVDPRGLVVPHESGWSLDWWIGGDDRWYLPATEGAVAQSLVDDTPVVATTLRVPGGEIVHTVASVRHGADDVLLVEIANRAAVPVALALALRPYGAVAPARVDQITLDGAEVVVDGQLALRLARPPARETAGSWIDGDVVEVVVSGGATDAGGRVHHEDKGTATAVCIVPLTHGTTQRIVLPVGRRPRRRRVGIRRREVVDRLPGPDELPPLARVVGGWSSLADGGTRIVTPDESFGRALAAGRGHLLRAAADLRIDARPVAEAASVVSALDRLGHGQEAAEILVELIGAQRPDGSWGDAGTTSLAVSAIGGHLARFGEPDDRFAAAVAAGAHRLLGWSLGGEPVEAAVAGLRRVAQPDAADALDEAARSRSGPSAPTVEGGDEGFVATAPQVRRASALLRAGDADGFVALADCLRSGSPTMTWPETQRIDGVRLARGEGHSAETQAALVVAIVDLVVRETPAGLDLFPVMPEPWMGQGLEIHDLPTRWGTVSAAVRWHGPRPAMLWDVHEPRSGLTLRAPGLDRVWAASEPVGETLLG